MSGKVHRCPACGMVIKAGFYVNESISQVYYHKNCFKCNKCAKSLWETPYVLGGLPDVFCKGCKVDESMTIDPIDPEDFRDFSKTPL